MAGTIVAFPQSGDTDRNSFITLLQKTSKGFIAIALTHYGDTTADPKIDLGSYVEVNGAVYTFGDSLALTGDSGDSGDVWFKVVSDGDSCSFQVSGDSGTWNGLKNGYYGTGDSANHRYIGGSVRDINGNYTYKFLYNGRITTSTSAPDSGNGSNDDIWFEREV